MGPDENDVVKISTVVDKEGTITQITDLPGSVQKRVLATANSQVHEALIKLGWTPPIDTNISRLENRKIIPIAMRLVDTAGITSAFPEWLRKDLTEAAARIRQDAVIMQQALNELRRSGRGDSEAAIALSNRMGPEV